MVLSKLTYRKLKCFVDIRNMYIFLQKQNKPQQFQVMRMEEAEVSLSVKKLQKSLEDAIGFSWFGKQSRFDAICEGNLFII